MSTRLLSIVWPLPEHELQEETVVLVCLHLQFAAQPSHAADADSP